MISWRPAAVTRGFSMIEMLLVLVLISMLVLAALPSGGGKIDQTGIAESLSLVERYKTQVEQYYLSHQAFPPDNDAAGMPEPEMIIGNYLAGVEQADGAMHLILGNKIRPELHGKRISVRPVFVPGAENSPISWVCGFDTVPANMVAAGENRTDVEGFRLPLSCR